MRHKCVSIRPGVSVLSVLRHLNYKPWFAMAEFVDNAVQSAIANKDRLIALHGSDWNLEVSIDIDTIGEGHIIIRDNAAGISSIEFPRAFRPAVVPPDSSGLSEFGMGMKSASCWFAPNWSVQTSALDEAVSRTVTFDVAKIVKDEIEELAIDESTAEANDHFTEVHLTNLYSLPTGRTLGKIKEHLCDIYRVFTRNKFLTITVNGESLDFQEPSILIAPYFRERDAKPRTWRKNIEFDFGGGLSVQGFAALMDPGSYSRSGFALFRRNRLIQGSADEGYRPPIIFGRSGRNSFASLRLFGELHLQGFSVTHTKDGFTWDDNEQPFLDLLRGHLDSEELPLLRQCANYRALSSRRDRTVAATAALTSTTSALQAHLSEVLPIVADKPLVETNNSPLESQKTLAMRELHFDFRGTDWLIRIELSDDTDERNWLTLSDPIKVSSRPERMDIRISMAHPFMLSFAQHSAEDIDPLLRVAAAIALAEKLATRAGVKATGTIRRNLNEILREALSQL